MSLLKHQIAAIEKADTAPHLALFHDMGTRKTATTVEILKREYNRQRRLMRTLIFAPLSVCPQWKKEFLRFSKVPESKILVLTQGTGKKRLIEFQKMVQTNEPFIAVTNYEAVQIQSLYEALRLWSPEIAVADEGHRLKDASSKRARAIYPLVASCQRRFLLTGTPIPNSLTDIFGQYRFLDPSIFGAGFWSFRSKYFYNANANKKWVNHPDWQTHDFAAEEIGRIMAQTSMQAKRHECLDLPPLQKIIVPVPMSAAQERSYKQMQKDYITEVKGQIMTAQFAMTKSIRLQQILAGFIQPDEREQPQFFEDQPRLNALMDILEGANGKKVIVWTTFQPTYKLIAHELEKKGYKYAFLTGEQSASEKFESIEQFCRGDKDVLIANPAAGGEGCNLQEAPISVRFTRGYNRVHYEQSDARNYRSGSEQHDRILQYELTTEGTLEAEITAALVEKRSVEEAVLKWSLDITKSTK